MPTTVTPQNASRRDTDQAVRHTIQLTIQDTGESVEVLVNRPIIIGRSDVGSEVDIDLTSAGGYRLGISRQHVRLTTEGNAIVAMDLQSRNGTRLNGETMRPMQPYHLRDGDILQMSSLGLRVSLGK